MADISLSIVNRDATTMQKPSPLLLIIGVSMILTNSTLVLIGILIPLNFELWYRGLPLKVKGEKANVDAIIPSIGVNA